MDPLLKTPILLQPRERPLSAYEIAETANVPVTNIGLIAKRLGFSSVVECASSTSLCDPTRPGAMLSKTEIQTTNDKAKQQFRDLRSRYKKCFKEKIALDQIAEKETAQRKALQNQLDHAHQQVATHQASLARAQQEIQQASTTNQQLQNQLTQSQADQQAVHQNIQQTLQGHIGRFQIIHQALSAQLQELETKKQALQAQLTYVNQEVHMYQELLTKTQQEIQQPLINQQLKTKLTQIKATQDHIDRLQTIQQSLQQKIDGIQTKQQTIQNQIDQLEDIKANNERLINDLQSQTQPIEE